MQGLVKLQEKVMEERPARKIFHLKGGTQGTQRPLAVDGVTKSRDPRGPGYYGTPPRGTAVTPPWFWESRAEVMWTPPPARIELSERDKSLAQVLAEKFGDAVQPGAETSDMLTITVAETRLKEVLRFLKTEASPKFRRLEDLTAIDDVVEAGGPICGHRGVRELKVGEWAHPRHYKPGSLLYKVLANVVCVR